MRSLSRREFVASSFSACVALQGSSSLLAADPAPTASATGAGEPIIDIHQHTNYHDRSNGRLLFHQQAMGATQTILLPAGSSVRRPSTNDGKYNGLGGVKAGGNDSCAEMAAAHPKEFYFGANEVTDLPEARSEIEKRLKAGAVIIGEQKFTVECDSPESRVLYALAAEYQVPILLHFQHGTYNLGYERFAVVLEKFPKTNFIGHAQTFWANIDKNHKDQSVLYPKGKVTAGGWTDRYLADFPNMFADMSAGSGLNALTRDEEHAAEFLKRHQDKLLFGSDCNDDVGAGPKCSGSQQLAAIRRLSPSKQVERKILYENAKKLFRLA